MKSILITCFNCSKERWFAISLFIIIAATGLVSNSLAAPYIPDSADDVLLLVPDSIAALNRLDTSRDVATSAEGSAASTISSLPQALKNARHYISLAKQDNDNRWYGFAQSALAPWWENAHGNTEVALIKAHLLLLNHNFPAALTQLQRILEKQARHPEALNLRANTFIMLSEYTLARSDCLQIMLVANPVLGVNCLARIKSLSGSGQQALDQVLSILELKQDLSPLERLETHINAAIFAHRLKQVALAHEHYEKALGINRNHRYLIEHYSDFLIEHEQWDLLARLIDSDTNVLDQRIKYALYLSGQRDPSATLLLSKIDDEFRQLQIINADFPHKEYATYLLTIKQDPHSALSEALKNWNVQQDPASALLALKCALAARNATPVKPVIDWIRKTGLLDYRISQVLESLTRMHTEL